MKTTARVALAGVLALGLGLPAELTPGAPAQQRGKVKTYRYVENSVGMKLAAIPKGKFLMGSPLAEVGHDTARIERHRVRA